MKTPNLTRDGAITLGLCVLLGAGLLWTLFFLPSPTRNLPERLAAAELSLKQARQTRTLAVTPSLSRMPLPIVEHANERKLLFIAAMLPLILKENARIEEQREIAKTANPESSDYETLATTYGLEKDAPRQQVLSRIDIVPASLALAQAALESGWGTSRFARQGNAFFGERTFDLDAPGIEAKEADDANPPFLVKSFRSAQLSIRSYMKTLNTNPAYEELRNQRAMQRKAGKPASGLSLVSMLHGYAEIGDAYGKRLTNTINANQFIAYDQLKLAP